MELNFRPPAAVGGHLQTAAIILHIVRRRHENKIHSKTSTETYIA